MKLHEHNTKQMEAIARYLAGEMDEAERSAFEEEASKLPDGCILIEQMKRDWDLMGQYKKNKEVNTGKAWEKLHGRFQDEQLIPEQKQVSMSSRNVMPVLRWAAIFVGIVTLGSVMFYLGSQKSTESLVTLTTSNEPAALIQTLKDGSTVYLANNTSFSYPQQFSDDERKVELKGEAYFEIARDPDKPFVIETSKATVEVLGTAFNVKVNKNNSFELIVERGKVRVTPKSGSSESFIVTAGEKLSEVATGFLKEKNDDNTYMVWRTKRMRFKDEPLGNIVKVLNSNYHTNIVVEDNDVAARKLTVTFDNSSIDTMTEVICVTMNLKSEEVSGSTILRKANGEKHK